MRNLNKALLLCVVSATSACSTADSTAETNESPAAAQSSQQIAQQPVSKPQAMPARPVGNLEAQRIVYARAQTLLDRKDVAGYQAIRPQIATYPLTPYIDYRVFLLNMENRSPAEVQKFKDDYATFPFQGRVSANYLDALARTKQWKTITEFQTEEPNGQRYQCLYYYANLQQGNKTMAYEGAKKLWLTGKSANSACDPLFDEWAKTGLRTDDLVLDRMVLGYKESNSGLFKFLDGLLVTSDAKQKSKDLQSLYANPAKVVSYSQTVKTTPFSQDLTEAAFSRLISRNTALAAQSYQQVMSAKNIPQEERVELGNTTAAWLMNTDDAGLAQWRDNLLDQEGLPHRLERRARISIQNGDWNDLQHWINKMPSDLQASLRWQFWQAKIEMAQGKNSQAHDRLRKMLGQRDFYSAAAAHVLGEPIRYEAKVLTNDTASLAKDAPALYRIEEMIAVDKIQAAKSEWRWLLSHSTQPEKMALAKYAYDEHWHNFAVVGTIEADMWDYISLRFPIAHRWWFDFYSKKNNVPFITLMSVARQESAMDVLAGSPVGARGLMQIMPATAAHTAKVHKLQYNGANDLYKPEKNIEIGSAYLSGLMDTYSQNRIYSFAAYNAGPGRVKQWRARTDEKIDAFGFIEAIPFDETRGYVQNILMFETYYRNLLGESGSFLTSSEANARY
ncbi:MAG: transglycosylase SLT domain-containing protein [Vibrio sp.]